MKRTEGPIKCDRCDKILDSSRHLMRHWTNNHIMNRPEDGTFQFPRPIKREAGDDDDPEDYYQFPVPFLEPKQEVNSSEESTYQCPIPIVEPKKERPSGSNFECFFCSFQGQSKETMKSHVIEEHFRPMIPPALPPTLLIVDSNAGAYNQNMKTGMYFNT